MFPDFAAAGRLAPSISSRGLRRFAALTNENDRGQQFEMQAFAGCWRKRVARAWPPRCPCSPALSLKHWRRTERTVAASMKAWQPPIGVYVGDEAEGRTVAQTCRNRGWRVPEDVAIITGQNEETYCEHLRRRSAASSWASSGLAARRRDCWTD